MRRVGSKDILMLEISLMSKSADRKILKWFVQEPMIVVCMLTAVLNMSGKDEAKPELDVLELQRQGTDQRCQSSHTPASPPPFSCAYFLTAPCEHPAISTCCYQVEAEVPQLVLRNPTSVTSTTFTAPL